MYRDAKVFADYSNLAPQVDKNYVQGCFELYLAKAGAIACYVACVAIVLFALWLMIPVFH